MSTSLERIAERIRDANLRGLVPGREVVVELVGAQGCMLVYVPPCDDDGVISAAELSTSGRDTEAAFLAAMPDFHQENVEVRIEGDEIKLSRDLCGTLPDGRAFRIHLRNDYLVQDGFITQMRKHVSEEAMAAIADAQAAGKQVAASPPQ